MKKMFTFLASMMLALGLMTPAAFGSGGGPKSTGGVSWTTPQGVDAQATFNAQVDKRGDVKGSVRASTTTGIDWSGTVTCYEQDGNTAIMTGTVDSTSTTNDLSHFRISVADNSNGGSDPDNPDTIHSQRRNGDWACDAPTPTSPVTAGNLTVHQE